MAWSCQPADYRDDELELIDDYDPELDLLDDLCDRMRAERTVRHPATLDDLVVIKLSQVV